MNPRKGPLWAPILTGAGAAGAVGVLGMLATDLSPWYYALQKPSWQPPDWLFGPVWTLIYGLTAAAGIIAWRRARDRRGMGRIIGLFALNALLNILWSALFFRFHRPDWSVVEVVFLWLSILVLIAALAPISRLSSWLLLPYLAWVTFAGLLNLAVVRLNFPFA